MGAEIAYIGLGYFMNFEKRAGSASESALQGHWKKDITSGFLVFLIALPLCLGISLASGYPAVAGIFTAIIGGILTPFLSNSQLTIKGPAAGLIVIVLGCITDFGYTMGKDPAMDFQAYRLALGVGVAAAVLQIFYGIFRSGILGDFFPASTVHGMLAAIGVIIIAKQLPVALGVAAKGEPLQLLAHIPQHFQNMNPEIAIIGAMSLVILFGLPLIKNRWVKMIPAQMVVVIAAVPLGVWLDLSHEHTYSMLGHTYPLGEKFLVPVPASLFGAITFPDFSGLATAKAWKWVMMYSIIGSLESMLSAKAVDIIDPWKRKTNLDKDLLAVGLANLGAAMVGGLPMISEIVRSRANIDNGAQTKRANQFHGLFLFLAVLLLPQLIHKIPLAALAAMLVYTGFRLAHPREFVSVFKIGWEQLTIYCGTIVAVLATDLLIGVFVGIGIKICLHLYHGLPLSALFKSSISKTNFPEEGDLVVTPEPAAVFTHWISIRRHLEHHAIGKKRNAVVDFSRTTIVDHTVMERLHEMERDFEANQLELRAIGLEQHEGISSHPLATRRKRVKKAAGGKGGAP